MVESIVMPYLKTLYDERGMESVVEPFLDLYIFVGKLPPFSPHPRILI